MTVTSTTRLLSPEEIAVQAGQQVAYVRLPERGLVFAEREMRLRQRASGHTMRDFLMFVAELAHVQHALLQSPPAIVLPDRAALDAASRNGLPPLAAASWPRDPAWHGQFRALVDQLLPRLAGSPAQDTVRSLHDHGDDWLDQQADRLLNGVMLGLDLAAAPLVAATLQVHWTQLVLATEAARGPNDPAPFGRTDDTTTCPCCGSRPTASVSRIGGHDGHRFLHCSLCSTQWHMVRIKCSHCLGTKNIHYQSLQRAGDDDPAADAGAAKQPVEAETCDECGHYLKIVRMERDANVEPVADDLASVTLDLLVAEAGFRRQGVNLLLLFGDPGDPDGGGG